MFSEIKNGGNRPFFNALKAKISAILNRPCCYSLYTFLKVIYSPICACAQMSPLFMIQTV